MSIKELITESRVFRNRMVTVANKLVRLFNTRAAGVLSFNTDHKKFISKKRKHKELLNTHGFALLTLCQSWSYLVSNFIMTSRKDYGMINFCNVGDEENSENKDAIILPLVNPKENNKPIVNRPLQVYLILDPAANHIWASTVSKKETPHLKNILIFIPGTLHLKKIKNSDFQIEIRNVLVHELTHVFKTDEEPEEFLPDIDVMKIAKGKEIDDIYDNFGYLLNKNEIRAYSNQAAHLAQKKNIPFKTALKQLIGPRSHGKVKKEIIDTYNDSYETDDELKRSFKMISKKKPGK